MNQEQSAKSFKSRIIGAGSWVLVGHVSGQALRLGSNLIMTRLLVPEMFGVMSMAFVLITGLTFFSDVGLKQNIIQSKRGEDPDFLNTAWTVQIVRGLLIWLLSLLIALCLYAMNQVHWFTPGTVYAEPVLPLVLAVISLTMLISGFDSTKMATANRKLALGKITLIELISQICGLVIMIGWALIDRSIWALASGALVASAMKAVLSHVILSGDHNRLHWEKEAFWEIFHFGKWIFLSSIIGFLVANGDRLLLGGLITTTTLGLYTIAFLLVNSIQKVVSKIANSVVFPALSEVVRDRPSSLASTYYKTRKFADIISLFTAGLLFMLGQTIIEILYDDRYLAAGPMLEILAVALVFERYTLSGQCFLALGKPQILSILLIFRMVGLYICLPIVYSWYGLEYALWVIGGSRVFSLPVLIYFKIKYELFSLRGEMRYLHWLPIGLAIGWGLSTSFKLIF